tara:strand:- start:7812 stop:8231 length:420 start_codon:yes stop_codon:yes gene_type:complete
MAFYTGTIAQIKLGSSSSPTDVLGQCTSYSLEKTVENVDVSSIGSSFKQFTSAQETWSATLEVSYDHTDTAQASALSACAGDGTVVYVDFYYEGSVSSDKYLSGNGFVTGISWSQDANSPITASVSIQGNSALTESTVP